MEQPSTSSTISDPAWDYFINLTERQLMCIMCKNIVSISLDAIKIHLYFKHGIYDSAHFSLWKTKKDREIWKYYKKLDSYDITCAKCDNLIQDESYLSLMEIHILTEHKEILFEIQNYIKVQCPPIVEYFHFKQNYALCKKTNCKRRYNILQDDIKTILEIHTTCHYPTEDLENNVYLQYIQREIDYTYIRPYCTVNMTAVYCCICEIYICSPNNINKIDCHMITHHTEKMYIIHQRFIKSLHCAWTSEHFKFKLFEVFCKIEGCSYSAKIHMIHLQEQLKLHLAIDHKQVIKFKEERHQTIVEQYVDEEYDDLLMFGIYTVLKIRRFFRYIKCNICNIIIETSTNIMDQKVISHVQQYHYEEFLKKRDLFIKTLDWIIPYCHFAPFYVYCKYQEKCNRKGYALHRRHLKNSLSNHLLAFHNINERTRAENRATDKFHQTDISCAGPSSGTK